MFEKRLYILKKLLTGFRKRMALPHIKCIRWKVSFFPSELCFDRNSLWKNPSKNDKAAEWAHFFIFVFLLFYDGAHTHIHTSIHIQKNKSMCRSETPNVWGSTPSDVYISRHYKMPLRAKRKKLRFFESLEVN